MSPAKHARSYRDLVPAVQAIYAHHAAGCCWHCVLDDANYKMGFVLECTADAKIPAGRVRTVSVRCPYPGCTAKHDYVTTDLFKVQAELPKA